MISISSPKILEKDDVAGRVNEKNKHLLFFDTCALLDIIRVPLPERKNDVNLHTHLIEVKNIIDNESIICTSSELCIREFNDNIPGIISSFKEQIDKIEKPLNRYIEHVNKSGLAGYTITKSDLKSYSLESYFSDIAEVIIDKILFIKEEETFRNLAHTRVIDKVPPALKKGEYKDCLIWETFVNLLRERKSYDKFNFFFSSNKDDYCELQNTNELHPSLVNETESYNCHFALTYTRLYHKFRELRIL